MNVIARPLSDADIENLAAWFASIPVQAPPSR
jgi:cytochrome c553